MIRLLWVLPWCLLVFTIAQIKILKIKTSKQMLEKAPEILHTIDIAVITRRWKLFSPFCFLSMSVNSFGIPTSFIKFPSRMIWVCSCKSLFLFGNVFSLFFVVAVNFLFTVLFANDNERCHQQPSSMIGNNLRFNRVRSPILMFCGDDQGF